MQLARFVNDVNTLRRWMTQDTGSEIEHESLLKRLQWPPDSPLDAIPPALMRKYVTYSRTYVFPRLSAPAQKVIQDFFLSLRRRHHSSESTPVTTRQLEALIRLCEARAKVELREVVTEQDAIDCVDLFKESMFDVCCDESGVLDFTRTSGMSKSKQARSFVSELHRLSESQGSSMFTLQDLTRVGLSMGIRAEGFDDFIESINHQGYILKKGPRLYQVQSSSASSQRGGGGAAF